MIELDVAVGVVAGVVILLFRHPIASIFSTDPEVLSAISFVLVFVAVSEPINGYVFALDGILIGAGDMAYLGRTMAMTSMAFVAMAATAWQTGLLKTGAGLGWLWTALGAFMVLRAITVWWRWRSNRWIVLGANAS